MTHEVFHCVPENTCARTIPTPRAPLGAPSRWEGDGQVFQCHQLSWQSHLARHGQEGDLLPLGDLWLVHWLLLVRRAMGNKPHLLLQHALWCSSNLCHGGLAVPGPSRSKLLERQDPYTHFCLQLPYACTCAAPVRHCLRQRILQHPRADSLCCPGIMDPDGSGGDRF